MVYKFTGQLLWNKKENKKIYTTEKSTSYLNGMSFFSVHNSVHSRIMERFWVISLNMWNVPAIEIKKVNRKQNGYTKSPHLSSPCQLAHKALLHRVTVSVSAFCYCFAQQIHPSWDCINPVLHLLMHVDFGQLVFSFLLDAISLQWFMIF